MAPPSLALYYHNTLLQNANVGIKLEDHPISSLAAHWAHCKSSVFINLRAPLKIKHFLIK